MISKQQLISACEIFSEMINKQQSISACEIFSEMINKQQLISACEIFSEMINKQQSISACEIFSEMINKQKSICKIYSIIKILQYLLKSLEVKFCNVSADWKNWICVNALYHRLHVFNVANLSGCMFIVHKIWY